MSIVTCGNCDLLIDTDQHVDECPACGQNIFSAPQTSLENNARALRAQIILTGYSGKDADIEDSIKDALTDMRHLAALHGFDFDAIIESSLNHFTAEVNGE